MRRVRPALIVVAAISVGYLVGAAFGWGGHGLAVGDLAMAGAALIGGGVATGAALRLSGGAQRAWLCFGLAGISWAAGAAVWCWWDLVSHREGASPGLADLGYGPALVLLPLAVALLPSAPTRRLSRLRSLLDGIILTGSVLVVPWLFLIGPIVQAGAGTGPERLAALAYPVGDVITAALVLGSTRRARAGGRLALRLVLVAVLLQGVADSGYALLTLHGVDPTGSPIDLGWILCYLLLGIAALAYESEVEPEDRRPLTRLPLALPYLAFAVTLPFLAWRQFRGGLDSVSTAVAGTTVIALLLRQWFTMAENAALVTALSGRQQELTELAFYDGLTRLPNRLLLLERLALEVTTRSPRLGALLLVDLDGFKQLNDSCGHAAGDELLIAVARRLSDALGSGNTVARLGGDEFGVLLEHGAETPEATAQRLCGLLAAPFMLSSGETFISASIGIARPELESTAEDLLRNAELAMYRAKNAGGRSAEVYRPALHDEVVRRHTLEHDLRLGVRRDEFVIVYQPVVALPHRRIVGVEALLRWQHPERGLISPADFIPAAESSGLLLEIGAQVLRSTCRQIARWNDAGAGLTLAVNASPRQVQSGRLHDDVAAALRESGLPPETLTLEITESVLLDTGERTVATLAQLRALGVRLALDDFGTGYASLSYLARLPVDILKVDRSFVSGAGTSKALTVLTEVVVGLADQLGLDVVAEGIETEVQERALIGMGCIYAQGYRYSRPVPPDQLEALLGLHVAHLA